MIATSRPILPRSLPKHKGELKWFVFPGFLRLILSIYNEMYSCTYFLTGVRYHEAKKQLVSDVLGNTRPRYTNVFSLSATSARYNALRV